MIYIFNNQKFQMSSQNEKLQINSKKEEHVSEHALRKIKNNIQKEESATFEENPQLLKIYADNQSKRTQIIHWGLFFGITLLTFIIVNFLPNPVQDILYSSNPECINNSNNPININNQTKLVSCEDFDIKNLPKLGLILQNLSTMNQFIVLTAQFYLKNTSLNLNFENNGHISFYSLKKNSKGQYFVQNEIKTNQSVKYKLDSSSSKMISQNGTFQGYTVQFAYLRNIIYSSYLFIVQFPLNSEAIGNVADLQIYASVINKQFSIFTIVTRYLFFGLSIVSFILYLYAYRRISQKNRIIEQKLCFILGILLIFFNDPFYILTITTPNNASNFFSVVFIINMIIALLYFWLVTLERIHKQNGIKETNVIQKKKNIQIVITYLFVLGYYLYFTYQHSNEPYVDISTINSGFFLFLQICALSGVVIILFQIIYLFFSIYKNYSQKIWRNRLFVNFSIFFAFCIFLFFFSNGFDIYSLFPNRILLIYVQINMYIIYLQYMYAPTEQAAQAEQSHNIQKFQAGSDIPESIKTVEIGFNQQYDVFDEQNQKQDNQQKEIIKFEEQKKNHQQFDIQ